MKLTFILLFSDCFLSAMKVFVQNTLPKEIAYTGGSVTIYQKNN